MQHQLGLGTLESKTNLTIGVDLDNTLIDYDRPFLIGARELGLLAADWHGGKSQVREKLRSRECGEIHWQNLQGQVYGQMISEARLFDGAYRFLWRCRQRGIAVDLVSHKTEYGHNDAAKVPLRKVASDFLRSHGITDGKDELLRSIYFESTREQKVQRIVENRYDWFIDDLPEVLEDVSLPNELGRILFTGNGQDSTKSMGTGYSWAKIESRLLGEWTESELFALAETVLSVRAVSVSWLARGGNSGLVEVTTESGNKYALKLYPGRTGHDRLSSEFNSFELIRQHGSDCVPFPFRRHTGLNAAMFEWIDGEVVSSPNQEQMRQALGFIRTLHGLRTSPDFHAFHKASAAFLSGAGFEEHLRARFNSLTQLSPKFSELNDYLLNELQPIMEKIIEWTQSNWRMEPGYHESLPREAQTLSPSDFGFHNAIARPDGRLAFIDFEYFGWDDPIKLIADFYFHPGMDMDSDIKLQWLQGAVKIYGIEILDRLHLAWPMIGISWCLILLNEYHGDIWLRRCAANVDKLELREEILSEQLKRSRDLLAKINNTYSQPLF
jgi:aminoglycoside phosphotransferase (APT) family kinase protein